MNENEWKQSELTQGLREQISSYVEKMLLKEIPPIPFYGYQKYYEVGSRKESEAAYFEVRKMLTALGVYLEYKQPEQQEITFFNELLWSVSNEFTWCLAAHLSYGDQGFLDAPRKTIDLFAAETAATLSELLEIHRTIIHPYVRTHLLEQIRERVLTPFLEREWGWETSKSNWSAVCAGNVGMAALLTEQGERCEEILIRVDKALQYYLNSYGEDGATEEGAGYWVYGFGYFIYYTAMRKKLDPQYRLPDEVTCKIKRIAKFPRLVQLEETSFVPFSDVTAKTYIPTGLSSYLLEEYGAEPPFSSALTPFDFDHCYRYAHISRNLKWTIPAALNHKGSDITCYMKDKQWLIQKREDWCFAVKGGHNQEDHNHNDVGSFILAIGKEQFLTDLGAGPYTAEYFGKQRYQYSHTRSYWHNLPLIQEQEQLPVPDFAVIENISQDNRTAAITMELSKLYHLQELKSFRRSIKVDSQARKLLLTDSFTASEKIIVEEGFVSRIRPKLTDQGFVCWNGCCGSIMLSYNTAILKCSIEEKEIQNHSNEKETVYRVGLRLLKKADEQTIGLEFVFQESDFSNSSILS